MRHIINRVLGRLESPLIHALPHDTLDFNPLHPDLTLIEGEGKITGDEEINSAYDEDDGNEEVEEDVSDNHVLR